MYAKSVLERNQIGDLLVIKVAKKHVEMIKLKEMQEEHK